jgi:thiol-disulfide isomerase/thioredoxin
LRGKYVVLDFWGTWCGWCIKGIPEMKEMYAKYSHHLEVVGIACGDTEEAWKKFVAEKALPWTNLLNGKGDADVSSLYAVTGYPTKIVLDPEGRILKTILGESPEFYTYVDSLMK